MNGDKIKAFMQLAGQAISDEFKTADKKTRELGAQLLLSETLEYVIKGLQVTPEFEGKKITDANALAYVAEEKEADKLEMLDGIADVAYTMYWNMHAFGIPLEEGFDKVCDNNLEKFVRLENWEQGECELQEDAWHVGKDITWPPEVKTVVVQKVGDAFFAVGKDETGKVRKPSSYASVDLSGLLGCAA